MLKSMYANVCWTPFHVINAINYHEIYGENEYVDFYICNTFFGAEEVSHRLRNLDFVKQVYMIDRLDYEKKYSNILVRKYQVLKDLLFPEKRLISMITPHVNLKDKPYKYIASAGYMNTNVLLQSYFYGRNLDFYSVQFEDGMESYRKKTLKENCTGLYGLACRVLKKGILYWNIKEICVYRPELVKKNDFCSKILPLLRGKNFSELTERILRPLFEEDKSDESINFLENMIYFDQTGTGDESVVKGKNMERRVLGIIRDYSDSIVVKMHPRAEASSKEGIRSVKTIIPWEILCQKINVNKKVLISISSSACVTPKLLGDEEPRVILLYNIIKDINTGEEVKRFYQDIRESYRDKSRFMIPENVDELVGCLEKVREEQYEE